MTGAEFKAARERLGLTYGELGAILGDIRPDTIRKKWERDKPSPSPMACQTLKWMLEGFRPPEWPSRLSERASGLAPGRVRCMDCRCDGKGSCPGETPQQQAAWRDQMRDGR